jgi:TrmH family RNA methyltransferase
VLKNFGFTDLRLVEPPRNYKDAEARKMSVGAFDILKNATTFDTLSAALKDVNFAVGTTSGQQREFEPLTLDKVITQIEETAGHNRVALVFGDERNGLTRQELERCHHAITIQTNPDFPALNVAQAIAICAYEISRHDLRKTGKTNASYPAGETDDEFFAQVQTLFDRISFSRTFNRETVLSELRQLYQRARPSTRELDLLKGVLHRVNNELA